MAATNNYPDMDSNGIPLSAPSICIPRVFPNISDRRIFAIFRELNVGFVDNIDLVSRVGSDGKEYNMVFVHFRNWFNNEAACIMRERLLDGEQIKIVYDEPWFWKIHAYKPKASIKPKDNQRATPFVDFEFREVVKAQQKTRPAPPVKPAPKRVKSSMVPNIYSALTIENEEGEYTATDDLSCPESPSYSPQSPLPEPLDNVDC